MSQELSKAERNAVERHRLWLSGQRGDDVSVADALVDWLAHHSQQWRSDRHVKMLAMEREEILRHKWIESEKRNRDVGAEAAFDWIRRYAAGWRTWFEEEYDGGEA